MAKDFLKFLGTAGARFVMIRQLRASGGIWICCKDTNVLVDPGPGSIVHCASSRPRLDPAKLDGIILTHRHLDHANDINVMIEAMTEGGFKKRGVVYCPKDAFENDSVILPYAKAFPKKIGILKAKSKYRIREFKFMTSMPHIHPAQTYGLKFKLGGKVIGLLTDTRYFKGLNAFYKKLDILIISVVFYEPRPGIDHLSLPEVERIIRDTSPRKTVLTHFGMTMLRANPELQARRLSVKLKTQVLAAQDGMILDF
ncbi:MAG: MBL fold metallo-hydrolase [Candidatus Omnitrophica bacterium]|nr:MBL fold metallo-hydrolase [Candidatus Omnitrophota bacterium]